MKKTIIAAIAAATAMALTISCQKEKEGITELFDSEPSVNITFKDADKTKAFFDQTASAETFEKKLTSLSILVFDENGQLVTRRNFLDEELSSKSCKFRLPKTVAGTFCLFYAVANLPVDNISTMSELSNLIESDVTNYNGTFATVTSAAARENGFVMSGRAMKKVAETGQTDISITLKRTVAKIALQTSISANFSKMYGGKLTILSATISNGASKTRVIESETDPEADFVFSHTQQVGVSDGKYNSLFYLYENEFCKTKTPAKLSINVKYDLDGKDTTTADQREFSYEINIDGKGNGVISRNGYYRIAAEIQGPEGIDCKVTTDVSDWSTPNTQNVDLGI